MKIITATLAIGIVFSACRYSHQQHSKDSTTVSRSAFSVIDSLEKYIGTDSLFVSQAQKYYVGKLNEVDYAFVQATILQPCTT